MAAVLGAALALGLTAVVTDAAAQGAPVTEATNAQKDKALILYRKAKRRFDRGQFEEALGLFRESYGVVASPNSHLMIARTLAEMDKPIESLEAYENVITEAETVATKQKKYKKTADSARLEMVEVEKKVGKVTIKVSGPPGSTVKMGEEAVTQDRWGKPIRVQPGTLKFVLTTTGGQQAIEEVSVAAGSDQIVDLAPPPPEPTQEAPTPVATGGESVSASTSSGGNGRVWAYVTGGIGLLGVASFATFGSLSQGKFDDLKKACPDRRNCDPSLKSDADQGDTFQTVANVSLIVGAAGLGAGIALFFTTGNDEKEKAATSKRPVVGVGPGSVVVSGKF